MAWLESAEDGDAPVKVRMHGKYSDRCFVVSKRDVERVMKLKWKFWGPYPYSKSVGTSLHQFIIGDRPADVPEEWVVDHANGDDMDSTRSNLRWVTQQFNTWNRKQKEGSSKYRGVQVKKGRYHSYCLAVYLGVFDKEMDAGIECAKYAICEFGDWATTSHVLLANFTSSELERMRDDVVSGRYVTRERKPLPVGVTYKIRARKYYVRCNGVYIGCYDTAEEAIRVNTEYRNATREREWEAHKKTSIMRDPSDGAAVIALSGDNGKGMFAKVPDEFWHELTFKTSWNLNGHYAAGHWRGVNMKLHKAVWELLNPGYKPVKGISIDHKNPELTLDNRTGNLRLASRSDQERNKKNRGLTSKYPGIWRRKNGTFCARVIVEGKAHNLTAATENEAAKALNALRIKLFGPNTPLITIIE